MVRLGHGNGEVLRYSKGRELKKAIALIVVGIVALTIVVAAVTTDLFVGPSSSDSESPVFLGSAEECAERHKDRPTDWRFVPSTGECYLESVEFREWRSE